MMNTKPIDKNEDKSGQVPDHIIPEPIHPDQEDEIE